MEQFDPTSAATWVARGRSVRDAETLASIWREFPDLPPSAPLAARMQRTRARVAAMRPMHDAVQNEQERARRARNFAFIEGKAANGTISDRDLAILKGRDTHSLDWDEALRYADGWYAARSGWPYREPPRYTRDKGSERAAYDVGFSDGGGDRGDLFDAARRAFIAAAPSNSATPKVQPQSSKPLPSSWPKPSDAPRPARWARRLVILAPEDLVARQQGGTGLGTDVMPKEAQGLTAVVFRGGEWATPAGKQFAAAHLRALLRSKDIADVLTTVSGEELAKLDQAAAVIPLAATCERAQNSLLQRRVHVRTWLSRGLSEGQNVGAGHIRWSKAAQGLKASLGEFMAVDCGSSGRGSHQIAVLLADGSLAWDFVDAIGRQIDPVVRYSNRSQIRAEMEKALRTFGGATRLNVKMLQRHVATNPGIDRVMATGGSTMNILHDLHIVLMVLTIPAMFALLMVTLRFWPPFLFGMTSVLLVAADEGQLARASWTVAAAAGVMAIALAWHRRTLRAA